MTGSIPTPDDLGYLGAAIDEARSAREQGNHPFGAIMVAASGRIVRAKNTVNSAHDPTGHAETNLVRKAAAQLTPTELGSCVLYTSTEPCAMCSGAIFWAGIPTVFYALGGDQLIELLPPMDSWRLALSSRDVFARGGHATSVHGPFDVPGAREVHFGYWDA